MGITALGDIRVTSGSRLTSSTVALTAGTTGTAEFFGTGNIPPVGSSDGSDGINAAVAAAIETATSAGLPTGSVGHILLDRGTGTAVRALGGTASIGYNESGTVTFKGCPPNAHFKIGFYNNAAHSGDNAYLAAATSNIIHRIFARSVNLKAEARIRVVGFN
jgi:hypothetical protein